jgi:c-di-GMP-binding flagellar brake protein YcgR
MNYDSDENRRKTSRFPIIREIRYRVSTRDNLFETGVGATVNISSAGVLFSTEKPLLPGRRVEVAISWPAELNRSTALKLVARGRIVRTEDGHAAAELQNFEFRTVGAGLGASIGSGSIGTGATASSPKGGSVIPFRGEG